jgi:uncharacterized membrane protein
MLHLVHPVLVHATVSFLIVGGLVEALGIARRHESAERFGGTLVTLGTALLVPTIVAGYLAQNSLTLSAAQASAVDGHERYGLMVLGAFVPLIILKAWGRGKPPANLRSVYVGLLLLGVALAAAAAYAGGVMVYELGVGVSAP